MAHKQSERGFAHLLPLLLILVVAIGGVGFYVMKQQKSTKPLQSKTTSPETTLATKLPTDLITIEKVKELASAEKPKMNLLGVQLENEDGTLVFKVKLSDNTTLSFNAKTGEAIKHATEVKDDVETELEGGEDLPVTVTPAITFAQAREIAMAQLSKSIVKKIELKLQDKILLYSVKFTDGGRVNVNATDGKVLLTKAGNKTEDKKDTKTEGTSTESHTSESSTSTSGSHDSTETHTSTTPTSTDDSSHSGTSGSTSGGTSDGTSGSGSGSRH